MPSDPPTEPSLGPPEECAEAPDDRHTAAPPPQAAPFGRPRRLHPTSVLLGLNLRQLAQLFIFPLAASPAGAQAAVIVLTLAGTIGLALRVLAWQRFHYSFDGEVLRVDAGVLSRRHRALHVDRIQQVEVDRSFLQRLLGLAALRVETAGTSGEVEVELRVVSDEEARALHAAVRAGKARANRLVGAAVKDVGESERLEPRRSEILRVPFRHVVVASVTGARLLVFPAVIAGAFEFAGENLEKWFETVIEQLVVRGVVDRPELVAAPLRLGLAVAAVVGLWLATAIVVGVLRDASFRIEQVEGDLYVSRGLLSTRDSVLPLRRVQLVQVHRNWLRRLLGYTSARVYSGGGSAEADRRVAIPLLPAGDVDAIVGALYPGVRGVPELASHPRSAMRRAIFRWLRAAAALVAAIWLLPFGWFEPLRAPVLVMLPAAVALGIAEYRQLGHAVTARIVASRRGALTITTSLAPVVKVQAVTTRASWFQRRLDLATVRVHIAGPGGDVEVLDAGRDAARELHARLTEHAAGPCARRTGAPRLPTGEGAAMSLQDRIQSDLTASMKARDRALTSALRLILAEMRNEAVARGRGAQGVLSDEEVQLLLRREMKRRRESAEAFRAAGRPERAAQEETEADLYASYLPRALGDDELFVLVDEVVAESGATGPRDMGRVMKAIMARVGSRAEGARVADVVRSRLQG